MNRTLTCIICPRGCTVTVTGEPGALQVAGNGCKRGVEYAIGECTNPVRTVTATVRVANRHDTMVSVKTETPVAKDKMMAVMAALRAITVDAPLQLGDVVLENVEGSRILVTKAVE